TFPLTVLEFMTLKIQRSSFWMPSRHHLEQARGFLREVGALELAEKRLGELSGGELQRVLIAAALANNPNILFLDEPSSGIDIGGEETVYSLIHHLAHEKGITILLISHDLDIVYHHANQVLCLNQRLICTGTPKEVLNSDTLRELYGEHVGVFEHAPGKHGSNAIHHHNHE
ncbi:MAG: ATP-binding cassette domain-containing protein, partial [bacterium]